VEIIKGWYFSELSDYGFSDPKHHGRVSDRSNAFNFGQTLAAYGKPLNVESFMRNQDRFLELLSGPAVSDGPSEMNRFFLDAMEALYK